jgi:hypothetical protein
MMPSDWQIQRFEQYPDCPVHVATFNRIQNFNWWFDGKEKKELIIGLSYKNGHAYLIAGKYELHGHLFFKKIYTRFYSRFLTLQPILFLRFPSISSERIEKVENDIDSRIGSREISCIELIRLVLERGAGIQMVHFESSMIYLQQYVDSFLRYGFQDAQTGSKIPLEVYLCERWSLSSLFEHLSRLEKRFYWLGHSGLWLAGIVRAPARVTALIKSYFNRPQRKSGVLLDRF